MVLKRRAAPPALRLVLQSHDALLMYHWGAQGLPSVAPCQHPCQHPMRFERAEGLLAFGYPPDQLAKVDWRFSVKSIRSYSGLRVVDEGGIEPPSWAGRLGAADPR